MQNKTVFQSFMLAQLICHQLSRDIKLRPPAQKRESIKTPRCTSAIDESSKKREIFTGNAFVGERFFEEFDSDLIVIDTVKHFLIVET